MKVLALLVFLGLALYASALAPLGQIPDEPILDEYIVVLKPGTSVELHVKSLQEDMLLSNGINEIKNTYKIGPEFVAYHAKLSPDMLARERAHPDVDFIDYNGIVRASQDSCNVEHDAIWGLDRIDERDLNLVDQTYTWTTAGEGVIAYVIDTGVQITHEEFGSRATWGTNTADTINRDCNGHGTHVAGTIAGTLYGVAKQAEVIAVKVLTCAGSGSFDGVIKGVEWVANDYTQKKRPSVANMSLGGGYHAATNRAVDNAVAAGVSFVVAAGNENTDACTRSPASATRAISVAATTIVEENLQQVDRRASFSNFGQCVDILAPGQLIKAAWIDTTGQPPNKVYNTISGTSMASPHVAGGVALLLSADSSLTPDEVKAAIEANASVQKVDLACGTRAACTATPNRLLYTHTCDN
jgi:subtilisin family serine protease